MAVNLLDAAGAGYRVGDKDATHFNREYKRLFGMPSHTDVRRMRKTLAPVVQLGAD